MKKTFAALLTVVMLLALFPTAALAADSTYSSDEVTCIKSFLKQPSAISGKTNAQALGDTCNVDDPASWSDFGVLWVGYDYGYAGTVFHVEEINWNNKSLASDLDLNKCTWLKHLDVANNQLTALYTIENLAMESIFSGNNKLKKITAVVSSGTVCVQVNPVPGIGSKGYVELSYDKNASPVAFSAKAVPMDSYDFKHWTGIVDVSAAGVGNASTTKTEYSMTPGKSYTITAWFQAGASCAVTFDKNGQDAATGIPAAQSVASGGKVTKPAADPACTGFTFGGWYKEAACTNAWNFDTDTVSAATTIFAKWTANAPSLEVHKITINVRDQDTLFPSIVGKDGSWRFTPDNYRDYIDIYLHGNGDGPLDITGLKAGEVTAIYQRNGVDETFEITIKDYGEITEASGLPYYLDGNGNKVFIGFASDKSGTMKYIAPKDVTVQFTQNPKSFTDIDGYWAKSSIDFVTQREIFAGTGDSLFSPDTGVTRAMFATVIGRLYERSYGALVTSGTHAFTDCDYSLWYGTYVDWCAENGIICGIGGGLFKPEREITREEMAVVLYRFANFLKLDDVTIGAALNYPDSAVINSWAQAAALYCQQTGIITGRDGGNFAPKETATRAEVAAIIERFIETVV